MEFANVSNMALGRIPVDRRKTGQEVTDQLDRILSSKVFRQADRLKRFLSFVVNETAAGSGERLKEFVVGVEVFGKDEHFDPRSDPIVRVQARRLRTRLARYYEEEAQPGELIIELPKGGYSPAFRTAKSPARPSLASTLVSRNTVAVIPFADYSKAGDQQFFCGGLAQEINQAIGALNLTRTVVWPRAVSLDLDDDLRRTVEELGVWVLVSGGVRISNGIRRVTSHLVDAVSGVYLWSETAEFPEAEEFSSQMEIARRIAAKIHDGNTPGGFSESNPVPSSNLAACNLYAQARYHLSQRTEESIRKAVEFFGRATAEDAQFAPAYSGLADAYGLLAHYGAITPAEAWPKAASNAAWAVLMNENSSEAHTSLAHVKATQDWDWSTAEREFRRAIDLDPRYPTARHWYSVACLVPQGRLDDALREILLAQDLDPISSIIARDVASVHYYMRQWEVALEQCDHTIELNPHFAPAYWMLALVQEQIGDLDEAAAAIQRAVELSPQSMRMRASLCRLVARSGKEREARALLKQLPGSAGNYYVSPFDLACIHFELGELNEGFACLQRALADRSFALTSAHVDPRLDCVRADSRLTTVLSQVGLASIPHK